MVRWLPPNGGGADTPGRLANIGRTLNRAWSWISPMRRWVLAGEHQVADRHAAGVEAHDERRHGAGRHEGARAVDVADVSAIAWAMSVPGWKYSFIRATPWTFFDSTWWMPVM